MQGARRSAAAGQPGLGMLNTVILNITVQQAGCLVLSDSPTMQRVNCAVVRGMACTLFQKAHAMQRIECDCNLVCYCWQKRVLQSEL